MSNNQELIWVDKDIAEKYNMLKKEADKRDLEIKMFDEYLQKITDKSKEEFKANFENLEEDVAIYTGLMLKVKQAFEKAKDEQLNASYALWEKFDKELPSIREKTQNIIDTLKPLQEKIKEINELMGKVNTWNIEKLYESINNISSLYGNNKEMVDFLVTNFKPKEVSCER